MASANPDDPSAVGFDKLDCVSDLHPNYFAPISAQLKGHAQTEMFHERLEVPVGMQQLVAAFDAPRGDRCIDGFSHGYARFAQRAKVFPSLNRNLAAAQLHDSKGCEQPLSRAKIPLAGESLQHFR